MSLTNDPPCPATSPPSTLPPPSVTPAPPPCLAGDVARKYIKDPELLKFIDVECFIWSTVSADLTPMINAGMVFCDRHFGGINYPVGGVGQIPEQMAQGEQAVHALACPALPCLGHCRCRTGLRHCWLAWNDDSAWKGRRKEGLHSMIHMQQCHSTWRSCCVAPNHLHCHRCLLQASLSGVVMWCTRPT